MSGRIDRTARWWWIPALISIGLTWYIRTEVLGTWPLTRYQFAGPFKPFASFRSIDAALNAFQAASYWTFLLIAVAATALGLACVYFRRTYQSPWMRNFGFTLALGVLVGATTAAAANAVTLYIVAAEKAASGGSNGSTLVVNPDVAVSPIWEHTVAALAWTVLFITVVALAYAAFGLSVYLLQLLSPVMDRGDRVSVVSQKLPIPEFGPRPRFSYHPKQDTEPESTGEPPSVQERVGVCSSGGGMRSATFSLGAYQALDETGVLGDVELLSAVSGGGYMAGARSAAALYLKPDQGGPSPYAHRSPEERHLRSNSSYLAPTFLGRVGMVSRLILGLVVNIVFVGAVIGLVAIPWGWFTSSKYLHEETSRRFEAYENSTAQIRHAATQVADALDGDLGRTPPRFIIAGTALLDAHQSARQLYEVQDGLVIDDDDFDIVVPVELELVARSMQLLLIDTAGLLGDINAALATEADAEVPFPSEQVIEMANQVADDAADIEDSIRSRETPDIPVDGAVGAIALALGLGLLFAVLSVSLRQVNSDDHKRIPLQRLGALLIGVSVAETLTFFAWPWLLTQGPSQLLSRSGEYVAAIQGVGAAVLGFGAVRTILSRRAGLVAKFAGGFVAPLMAVVGFFAILRIGATSPHEHYWLIGFLVVYLLVMGALDLNVWSLHPWYRRRLRTAFAVKREGDSVVDLTDEELVLSRYGSPDVRPRPLICAAANVSDPGGTPTALNAVSFRFDARSIGTQGLSAEVRDNHHSAASRTVNGWVETEAAQRVIKSQQQEMSLLGAMAISGAAVSPGMGKMTLRSVQALLALSNIRLGVWYPNPIWLNELLEREPSKKWRERVRASYLFKEMFGIYRQTDKFLYVSDGGHWENLGLVELLRLRCTLIYCFDASGDRTDRFKTLGEAIAIARTDLGIDFVDVNPYGQRSHPTESTKADKFPVMRAEENVSVFEFSYPDQTRGKIIYCKPVVTDGLPVDVKEYQESNPEFPAHSTLDQFFDHEQFEAYRMLGYAAGTSAAATGRRLSRTSGVKDSGFDTR